MLIDEHKDLLHIFEDILARIDSFNQLLNEIKTDIQ
jgi:hypothetical protein